jgi:hypothetical protein
MRDAAVDDDVTWTPGGATLILNSIPHSDTRRLDHVRAQRHADPSVDGAGRARQHRASMIVAASACAIRHRSVRGRARASPPAADPLACAHRPPGRRGEASASLLFGLLISLRRDKFVPPRRAPDRHILNDTRGCGLQASYIAARTHAHASRAPFAHTTDPPRGAILTNIRSCVPLCRTPR